MLTISVPGKEFYDEERDVFVSSKSCILQLEHSLSSIYLWESKWNKPFLNNSKKTLEETIDYIRCMTLNSDVPSDAYDRLPYDIIDRVNEYMNLPMTATTFREIPGVTKKGPSKVITAEIVYYWMFRAGVPLEWEKRHFNQLITMIRVCNEKDAPPKKMKKKDMLAQRNALNAARRNKLNTRG